MTAHSGVSKTFRLSDRLSVEVTVSPIGVCCEWDPEMPDRLTGSELRAYHRARAEMLQGLATRMGKAIAVVEI